jgi:hypothetical protein
MKFHQLPVGSRFRLDGEWYVKSTPLIGTQPHSGQDRLIRRSAVVELAEGPGGDAEPSPPQPPERALLAAALADYRQHCDRCLDRVAERLPEQLVRDLRTDLGDAWGDLRARLELPTA